MNAPKQASTRKALTFLTFGRRCHYSNTGGHRRCLPNDYGYRFQILFGGIRSCPDSFSGDRQHDWRLQNYQPTNWSDCVSARHLETVNTLFADGHAKAMKWQTILGSNSVESWRYWTTSDD